MDPELEKLKEQETDIEHQIEQAEHRETLYRNRIAYLNKSERKKRNHRLITRGAAVESIVPAVKDLNVLLKEPEARKLEADIYRKDDLRRCARCGKPFAATGSRSKYCADCKGIVQREQKAEYARRRRAESRKTGA